MATKNKGNETRGRPKKEQHRTLDPKYKKLFPENSAVACSCCLIYVFQIFVQTKTQRRVGHKDGGYTMFQKISSQYSFDSFEDDLKEWNYSDLLQHEDMKPFLFQLPALGPKIILKEVMKFIKFIVDQYLKDLTQDQIELKLMDENIVNKQYKHMRFTHSTLQQLKMDKFQKNQRNNFLQTINRRVNTLWKPFIKIMVYTVINALTGQTHNKYYKPFFSDAENPQETYIGQLNLPDIVKNIEKIEQNRQTKYRIMNHPKVKKQTLPVLVITNPTRVHDVDDVVKDQIAGGKRTRTLEGTSLFNQNSSFKIHVGERQQPIKTQYYGQKSDEPEQEQEQSFQEEESEQYEINQEKKEKLDPTRLNQKPEEKNQEASENKVHKLIEGQQQKQKSVQPFAQ